jgi:hypothetical protein
MTLVFWALGYHRGRSSGVLTLIFFSGIMCSRVAKSTRSGRRPFSGPLLLLELEGRTNASVPPSRALLVEVAAGRVCEGRTRLALAWSGGCWRWRLRRAFSCIFCCCLRSRWRTALGSFAGSDSLAADNRMTLWNHE